MAWSNWKISGVVFVSVGLATLLVALILSLITKKMLGCETTCNSAEDCKKCADAVTQRRVGAIMAIVGACVAAVGVILMIQDWRYRQQSVAYEGTMKRGARQPNELKGMTKKLRAVRISDTPVSGGGSVPPEYWGQTQRMESVDVPKGDPLGHTGGPLRSLTAEESNEIAVAKRMAERRKKRLEQISKTKKGSKKGSKSTPAVYNVHPPITYGKEIKLFKEKQFNPEDFKGGEIEFDRYRKSVGIAHHANIDIGESKKDEKKRSREMEKPGFSREDIEREFVEQTRDRVRKSKKARKASDDAEEGDNDAGGAGAGGIDDEGILGGPYDPEADQSTSARPGSIGANAYADWKVEVEQAYKKWAKSEEGLSYPNEEERKKAYVYSADRKYPIPFSWSTKHAKWSAWREEDARRFPKLFRM